MFAYAYFAIYVIAFKAIGEIFVIRRWFTNKTFKDLSLRIIKDNLEENDIINNKENE